MVFRWLAIAVIVVHLAYLAYLIVGGLLAWRWPRTFPLHVAAVAWALIAVLGHVPCPLTWLQSRFREWGGEPPIHGAFINRYLRGVFFPSHDALAAAILIVLIVGVSWLGLWLRRHRAARGRPQWS